MTSTLQRDRNRLESMRQTLPVNLGEVTVAELADIAEAILERANRYRGHPRAEGLAELGRKIIRQATASVIDDEARHPFHDGSDGDMECSTCGAGPDDLLHFTVEGDAIEEETAA